MPLINGIATLAAGTTNENILSGSEFEYLPFNAGVEIILAQTAGALGDCRADVTSGTDILATNMPIQVRATGVNLNDDPALEDIALAGERLKIRVRNGSAGSRDIVFFCRLTPQ